jgi:hypothetical protein
MIHSKIFNIPDITACPQCYQLSSQPRLLSFNDMFDSFFLDGEPTDIY